MRAVWRMAYGVCCAVHSVLSALLCVASAAGPVHSAGVYVQSAVASAQCVGSAAVCLECREVCSECRDSKVRLCVCVESAAGSAQSDAVRVESVHDVFGVWFMAYGVWRMLLHVCHVVCGVWCRVHGV